MVCNQYILKLVTEKRLLTLADIEHINTEANEEVVSGSIVGVDGLRVDRSLLAGIVRGTVPRIRNHLGVDYLVDVSRMQIYAGSLANFTTANEVPTRLNQWISQVNHIGAQTDLYSILSLYRDYILIHPFFDGNGRTARILVDYMLMKAGFPPMPHDVDLIRDVLYLTLEELYAKVIWSYQLFNRFR